MGFLSDKLDIWMVNKASPRKLVGLLPFMYVISEDERYKRVSEAAEKRFIALPDK